MMGGGEGVQVNISVHRSPRWSSWYPRKPSNFQVMGSSPGELSLFVTFVPGKIGRDFF